MLQIFNVYKLCVTMISVFSRDFLGNRPYGKKKHKAQKIKICFRSRYVFY